MDLPTSYFAADAPLKYRKSALRWPETISSTFQDLHFDGPLNPVYIS